MERKEWCKKNRSCQDNVCSKTATRKPSKISVILGGAKFFKEKTVFEREEFQVQKKGRFSTFVKAKRETKKIKKKTKKTAD